MTRPPCWCGGDEAAHRRAVRDFLAIAGLVVAAVFLLFLIAALPPN